MPSGAALLVAILLITGCEAPAGGGGSDEVKAIDFTSFRRELEFIARLRDQEQKSKVGAGNSSSSEEIFEEAVRLETDGSVYHPNLMEFSLAGLFGLLQEDFEDEFGQRKRSSSDDGDILEFDLEGRFFKKKDYPGTVYARRYRSLEPRPFLSSLETTTTNYGFVWQYVDDKMPTNLQFNHTDVLLDPLNTDEQDGEQQNDNLRFETSYRFTDNNVLSFTYEHRSVSEQPYELDYDSDELTLNHRWDFGSHHQHSLESELNYFDQRGTFDIERTRWREILRLTHTDSLRSWYQFEFLDRTQGSLSGVPPIGETSYLLTGTLEHRLYDSLISQLFAFGQRQEFDSGLDIDRWGIQPSIDYRKKNPWGVLLATYMYRYQTEDRHGGGFVAEVLDERGTFVDPEPVVLNNMNVIQSSIFITAEDRLTTYRLNEDYRVRLNGDLTEIERVPTGRIVDGETVLIDYTWAVAGDYTLDTAIHNFGIRQNFDFGLSPYYRYRRQNQDLSPEDATGVEPEDLEAHIYGAEFERWRLHLLGEYEDHQSNINPFEAVRLAADYTQPVGQHGTLRLRTRWTDLDRSGDIDRRTKLFTIEGRYRQRIGEHLTVEGSVLYRTEDDSVSGDDEGLDADFSLEWIIRDTELRLTYEYGQYEDDFAENNNQTLFVQLKRKF